LSYGEGKERGRKIFNEMESFKRGLIRQFIKGRRRCEVLV